LVWLPERVFIIMLDLLFILQGTNNRFPQTAPNCWYSFQYDVNLHILLVFFTLLNNFAKQQKLRDPSSPMPKLASVRK
jgi:hypothetical protein